MTTTEDLAPAAERSELDALIYDGDDPRLYTGELELLGTWEVARYLGIERSRVARWLEESRISRPIARLKSVPLWTFGQVREKAQEMYLETLGAAADLDGLDAWLEARRERRGGR